jgi:hypothetical protein
LVARAGIRDQTEQSQRRLFNLFLGNRLVQICCLLVCRFRPNLISGIPCTSYFFFGRPKYLPIVRQLPVRLHCSCDFLKICQCEDEIGESQKLARRTTFHSLGPTSRRNCLYLCFSSVSLISVVLASAEPYCFPKKTSFLGDTITPTTTCVGRITTHKYLPYLVAEISYT